ncbi:MAG: type II secretion system F family protein [Acidimicrobiales bacterium]
MSRLVGLSGLVAAIGWALVLSEVRWFRRRSLVDRVAPYLVGSLRRVERRPPVSSGGATWRALAEPLARSVGERLARACRIAEPLSVRLERVHWPSTVGDFRMRQLAWAGGGLALGTLAAGAFQLPGVVALLFVVGGAVLGFLVVEQQLVAASDRWRRHVFLELPVVAEQLGMLLGAGYSLTGALSRIAQRGKGACGRDIARVCERLRLGLSEVAALREWAAVADVPALHRLVAILALNRQGGDLDRLVSEEARSMRRDVHRQLLETIERRSQQVWVPVTVATLVPGVIFLAVPFVEALRMFARS